MTQNLYYSVKPGTIYCIHVPRDVAPINLCSCLGLCADNQIVYSQRMRESGVLSFISLFTPTVSLT